MWVHCSTLQKQHFSTLTLVWNLSTCQQGKTKKCFIQSRNFILFYIVLILCVDVCIQINRGNKCLLWKWHVMLWLKFGDVVDSLSVRDRGHAENRTHGTRRRGSTYMMLLCSNGKTTYKTKTYRKVVRCSRRGLHGMWFPSVLFLFCLAHLSPSVLGNNGNLVGKSFELITPWPGLCFFR